MAFESIAICIPCLNEELTIAKVVADFSRALPSAAIYVLDNGSTDDTAQVARKAGARVICVPERGKGRAVRAMFELIDADVYVMVDGDGTYPAEAVGALIEPVLSASAEMVVASRLHPGSRSRFSPLHRFGNRAFVALVNSWFGTRITDLLSGYRAFSRDFVRRTRLASTGFEIETELTLRAALDRRRTAEIGIDLGARPHGSESKLCTFQDGVRILRKIVEMSLGSEPHPVGCSEAARAALPAVTARAA